MLSEENSDEIERVQKCAYSVIFGPNSYQKILQRTKNVTLRQRRVSLTNKFAVKCVKNEKTIDMIPLKTVTGKGMRTETYTVPMARKQRLYKSAIPTMARMLNEPAATDAECHALCLGEPTTTHNTSKSNKHL